MKQHEVDILAFGAHPDDVEFGCGGLLVKAAKSGLATGIVDLSLAELSTNGTVEIRKKEAEKAREILGVSVRENLEVPNNFFFNSRELQDTLIRTLRKYRPRMVLLPYFVDRHPDHEETPKLVKQAIFTAGLVKYKTDREPHRPEYVLHYMLWHEFEPTVVFDITEEWEAKKKALLAYESQFVASEGSKKTIDNDEETVRYWESRARAYGFRIGKPFGEPYWSYQPVGLQEPFGILPNVF